MIALPLERVPSREEVTALATVAPPGETALSSDGPGTGDFGRRFRRRRDDESIDDEDRALTEPRLPSQPGEALLLGARVDVIV